MSAMRLKSPASRLFTEPFIQAQIKESIKVPYHWPLWGEFPRASNAENFPFDDVVIDCEIKLAYYEMPLWTHFSSITQWTQLEIYVE